MSQSPETYTVTIDVQRSKTDGLISSSAVYGLHNLPREVLDYLHLFTSPEYLEDVPEDEEVPQRGQQRPANWAIVTDGGVSDRFYTQAEADTAMVAGGYPAGSEVVFQPEPFGQ